MQKFKDGKDREWTISLTYGMMQRVKEDLGIDLLDLKEFTSLQLGIAQFANLLYFVCGVKAQDVSEADFWDGFAGDVFDEAFTAFQEEYIAFFPKSQREAMRAALGQANQATTLAMAMGVEEIQNPTTLEGMKSRIQSARPSIRGAIDTALKESRV